MNMIVFGERIMIFLKKFNKKVDMYVISCYIIYNKSNKEMVKMIIKQFQAGDFLVSLYEYTENKNIVGRTVYTLGVQGKGTFIYNLTDEKDEAIKTYEKVIMYIVEGHFNDEERTLRDIVEYLN